MKTNGTFHPLALSDEEKKTLTAPAAIEEVEIRPDNGAVYMPEVFIRRRLNAAFGPGQWTLWENEPPRYVQEFNEILYDATLIIREVPVSRARGGKRWRPADPKALFKGMTFASAVESAKSECLRRCAKDLGVGTELWDSAWREAWKREHAQRYDVVNYKTGEVSKEWHRRDRPPHNLAAGGGRREHAMPRGSGKTGRGGAPEQRRDHTPSSAPAPDEADPSDRSAGATPNQVRAIRNLIKGLPAALIEAQLHAHGAERIEDLTKGAASELITWVQAERT